MLISTAELALLFAKSALALCEENKLQSIYVSRLMKEWRRGVWVGGDRKAGVRVSWEGSERTWIVKAGKNQEIFGEQITETER